MRASVSSDEIASARISCSDRSLKFFAMDLPGYELRMQTLFSSDRRTGSTRWRCVLRSAGSNQLLQRRVSHDVIVRGSHLHNESSRFAYRDNFGLAVAPQPTQTTSPECSI